MLFELPKRTEEKNSTAGAGLASDGAHQKPVTKALDEVLALLSHADTVHWVSDGDWSMHNMLQALLARTGPAHVYLSTYAFSELPARIIAELISQKTILELHCLIDSRIDVRSASAFNMIRSMATRCKLVNTHAKVTVIENRLYSYAVIGSANYTTNKRYEAGIIVSLPAVVNFHKTWIQNELNRI